jgi:phosphopantetheinyl transferase
VVRLAASGGRKGAFRNGWREARFARKIGAMSDVIVLHAALAGQGGPGFEQALLERLPYAYRLGLERRDAAARSTSLQGLRLLAEGILSARGAAFDPSRLRFPQGGKPFLEGGPQFSISHSACRVAVALSERCEVGLDIEDVGTRGRSRADLERWTAVEASLKALGASLRRAAEVRLSPDLATARMASSVVHLRPVALAADCIAMLATREPVGRVEVVRGQGTGDRGQ